MEISLTVFVKNEEVLHRVKKERNILHTIKRIRAKWNGHVKKWPVHLALESAFKTHYRRKDKPDANLRKKT